MRKWTRIRYVDGYPPVPHWFTRIMHWRGKLTQCRNGHTGRPPGSNLCSNCGEVFER